MASPEAICGSCSYFDLNDVSGKPVGKTLEKETEIDLGLCRAEKGLMLGARKETDKCLMPEGTFKPAQPLLAQNLAIPQESPAL